MGQLEDLQRNRLARMQYIQKGFCGDDNQDDIVKAHNVGDVHPNHPDWVWTQLPNGKYDWRVRKGQAKPAPTPAPKPSGEPDFTPKIPQEIASLTNRSDWQAFEAAYQKYGNDLFAEKYPDEQSWKDAVAADKIWYKDKGKEAYHLAMERLGLIGRGSQQPSKTAQIEQMKQLYVSQAKARQEAHQKAKNEAYWAGEGAKRKAEIEKELDDIRTQMKAVHTGAEQDIRSLLGYAGKYEMRVDLSEYGISSFSVRVNPKGFWDHVRFQVDKHSYISRTGGTTVKSELSLSSMRANVREPSEWAEMKAMMNIADRIVDNADSLEKTILKRVDELTKLQKRSEALAEELKANH